MKAVLHSHAAAESMIGSSLVQGVLQALSSVGMALRPRCASELRTAILENLATAGWSDRVRITSKRGLTLTAMNGKTALCLQTGNMARFYADLLKLQAQYLDGKISSAIYVLPSKSAAIKIGQNVANFERMTSELTHVFPSVITVPLLVVGFTDSLEVPNS